MKGYWTQSEKAHTLEGAELTLGWALGWAQDFTKFKISMQLHNSPLALYVTHCTTAPYHAQLIEKPKMVQGYPCSRYRLPFQLGSVDLELPFRTSPGLFTPRWMHHFRRHNVRGDGDSRRQYGVLRAGLNPV